jgi:hypothetical protein
MTTPNIKGRGVFNKSITIIENYISTVYMLGDDTYNFRKKINVRTFEDYNKFFSVLQAVFTLRAGAGAGLGNESVFVSDIDCKI